MTFLVKGAIIIKLIRDGAVPVFSPRDVLAEYLPRFPGELHDVPDKSFGELLRENGEQPETLSREPLTAAAKPRAPKNAHGAEPPAAAPAEKRALPESLSENAQRSTRRSSLRACTSTTFPNAPACPPGRALRR